MWWVQSFGSSYYWELCKVLVFSLLQAHSSGFLYDLRSGFCLFLCFIQLFLFCSNWVLKFLLFSEFVRERERERERVLERERERESDREINGWRRRRSKSWWASPASTKGSATWHLLLPYKPTYMAWVIVSLSHPQKKKKFVFLFFVCWCWLCNLDSEVFFILESIKRW